MFPLFKKDVKPVIRFLFTKQHRDQVMTWDDEITIYKIGTQATDISPEAVKILTAHFMVDETNQAIPEERALKILGKLNKIDREEVFAKLQAAIVEAIVPKANGSDSSSKPDPGSAETLPNGQPVSE